MIVATIEARMGSSRLPGKVLADIVGRPALGHLVDRLRRARRVDEIVLATTTSPTDEPLVEFAKTWGVHCYRGSEDDVLDRVVRAVATVGAETVVEVTGDCPLLDPEVIDRAVGIHLEGGWDVVSNTWRLSYPQGVDAQVFAWASLDEVAKATDDPAHREHVSLYFYEHPERYRIYHMEAPAEFRAPELRFQLDYPEDLAFIRAVYEALHSANPAFSLKEIFDLLARRPELREINGHMQEKPLR